MSRVVTSFGFVFTETVPCIWIMLWVKPLRQASNIREFL
ncbi:protein of unknown function [Shewanella benthica]|uniref:Uncharacterized protein n=1 Tax=Shewanella benthica TaxID=43661 RepID=A0A330M6S8_9GAMM|nr:protein of unknown function [Shewanella benthica]